jgi:6-phosphofructokinase 2
MDYLVVSGSMAPGIPAEIMADLSAIAKKSDAKLVVDTSGDALAKAVGATGVFLLKPNLGELAALTGRERFTPEEVPAAARDIIRKGGCSLMVVSMGADGALMVSAEEQFYAKAPAVEKKSTVGAGDSMVAGILFALASGWPLNDVLRYGVACGTAATINEGTALCRKTDADSLSHQIVVQPSIKR